MTKNKLVSTRESIIGQTTGANATLDGCRGGWWRGSHGRVFLSRFVNSWPILVSNLLLFLFLSVQKIIRLTHMHAPHDTCTDLHGPSVTCVRLLQHGGRRLTFLLRLHTGIQRSLIRYQPTSRVQRTFLFRSSERVLRFIYVFDFPNATDISNDSIQICKHYEIEFSIR